MTATPTLSAMSESVSTADWEGWDGRLFHVTSVLNRESIDSHGLDWNRMGLAPGIGGNRTPLVEGCFLAQDEEEADFFLGFDANERVDVWLIKGIHWAQLVKPPEGFWYYPDKIPRSMMSLYRRSVATWNDMEDAAAQRRDDELVDLLVQRDGVRTIVCLRDGRRLSVFNIGWGYDEGDSYAHVTTNISPNVRGERADIFSTSEIATIKDETGAVLHRNE